MTIRTGTAGDTPALRALWELCFPGDQKFSELFFKSMYMPSCARVLLEGESLAAALYAFPYEFTQPGGKHLHSWYIYGVGTHPALRGKGYAGALIEKTLREAWETDVDLCCLIPQDQGLFEFYRRFGFKPAFFLHEEIYSKTDSIVQSGLIRPAEPRDILQLDALYNRKLAAVSHLVRPLAHWDRILREFELYGGVVYVLEQMGALQAYGAYVYQGGVGTIQEIFAVNHTCKGFLLGRIAELVGQGQIHCIFPGGATPLGSACPLTSAGEKALETIPPIYMNLMHN